MKDALPSTADIRLYSHRHIVERQKSVRSALHAGSKPRRQRTAGGNPETRLFLAPCVVVELWPAACVLRACSTANSVLPPFLAYSHCELPPTTPFSRLSSDDPFLDILLGRASSFNAASLHTITRLSTSCDARGLPLFPPGTINRGASGRLQETVYVEHCGRFSIHPSRTVEPHERIPHDPQRFHSSSPRYSSVVTSAASGPVF